MFKLADQFLNENDAVPTNPKLNRAYINKTFDAYKKKKEQQKDKLARGSTVTA